jgi:hypothetical protein
MGDPLRTLTSVAAALVAHDGLAGGARGHGGRPVSTGRRLRPKGLRHGFGVAAVAAGIPLNLVRK